MARLQREDFDIGGEILKLAGADRKTGAAVTFLGTAKELSRGEKVAKLEFESYDEMALKELEKLESEARDKFDILGCLVIHRIGEIPVGANIVLIVVTSRGRAAAFDACEWMIDELKRRVPIWKKEYTESGSHWVEDRP